MAPYVACKSYRAEFEEVVLSEGQILWSLWSLWCLRVLLGIGLPDWVGQLKIEGWSG